MLCRDLRLNLALANVLLLPLGIWFDSRFWPVSNSPRRVPTAVLKGFVFGKRWKKFLLENTAVGKGQLQNDCEKGFFNSKQCLRCNHPPVTHQHLAAERSPVLAGPLWLRFTILLPLGSQISCFSPTNFTGKQSAYVDTACWDSLVHYGFDTEGHAVTKSLWALKVWVKLATGCPQVPPGCPADMKQLHAARHPFVSFAQVFPYSLLVVAVLMYMPYLLWRYAAAPALHSDLLFIIDELDKSYNRSVRLVQHMRKVQQASAEPERFWEEYER